MSLLDEPDFEVTDLRTGRPDERVYAHADERRQRRRVMTAIVTLLVVVCALIVPFYSVPGFGATLRQALRLPTATPLPQLAEGADVIYFEHGLPWGALLLDGRPVVNVDVEQPYTGFEALYTSLRIPRGRHQFTYSARPFPPLQCWISVPAAASDTCPLIHTRGVQDVSPPFPAERVMNLGGDPSFLLVDRRVALEAAATRAVAKLSSTTTLSAGDPIAGPTGIPQIASERMTATLSYTIATDSANVYVIPGSVRTCAILCAIQAASYVYDARAQWVVAAHVIPTWTYTRSDGSIMQGSASPIGVQPDSVIPLAVSWNGAWQVSLADSLASSPMCYVALNLIAAEQLSGAPLSSLKMVPAPNQADGCLVMGNALDATGIPRIPFTVMYRFGLLLTIDDEARLLLPTLPPADTRLRTLAQTWME